MVSIEVYWVCFSLLQGLHRTRLIYRSTSSVLFYSKILFHEGPQLRARFTYISSSRARQRRVRRLQFQDAPFPSSVPEAHDIMLIPVATTTAAGRRTLIEFTLGASRPFRPNIVCSCTLSLFLSHPLTRPHCSFPFRKQVSDGLPRTRGRDSPAADLLRRTVVPTF